MHERVNAQAARVRRPEAIALSHVQTSTTQRCPVLSPWPVHSITIAQA
jgi:hypothetical protein